MNASVWSILCFSTACMLSGFAPFFIKTSSMIKKKINFLQKISLLVIGLGIYVSISLTEILALKNIDLSMLYPFAALTYLSNIVVGKLLLHEELHWNKIVSIGIILVGILITQL